MLRALGIAFIVCTFLFFGLLVFGLGFWAIASGTVRIAGINDRTDSAPPDEPFRAADRRAFDELTPTAAEGRDTSRSHRPGVFRTASLRSTTVDAGMELTFSVSSMVEVDGIKYSKAEGVTFTAEVETGTESKLELVVFSSAPAGGELFRKTLADGTTPKNEQGRLRQLPAGRQTLYAALFQDEQERRRSRGVEVEVLDGKPRVDNIDPFGFGSDGTIRIQFARSFPVDPGAATNSASYELHPEGKDENINTPGNRKRATTQ